MESQFTSDLLERIQSCGVVAVLVIDHAKDAVPVANALLAGGVDAMELTLRTPAALESLKAIRSEVPEMLAGIGTILTPQQISEVVEAGASFGVSPGTNPVVIREAQQAGLPFAPGVLTPSDIEVALALNCRELKFFPAEPSGGLPYLKSMAAPYLHLGVRFVPLGGVNSENLKTYLADPLILAVGGSWLAPRSLIDDGQWDTITSRASEAMVLAAEASRGSVT
jgi:2-dehydro-3-deoxyphosphogluconate aldolase/(4S)-4-hydroxy-2-oxoglutarate aldolase